MTCEAGAGGVELGATTIGMGTMAILIVTVGAAATVALPDWSALMTQLPSDVNVATFPVRAQTPVVVAVVSS